MLSNFSPMKIAAAAAVSSGLLAAPAAHAEWHRGGYGGWHGGYGGWHGGYDGWHRGGFRAGPVVAGVLGFGAGALVGSALAPRAYYAPPPVYYAPRPYYAPPPPTYYAPPPAYGYAAPGAYYAPPPY